MFFIISCTIIRFIVALPDELQTPAAKEKKGILSRLSPEKHPVVERPTQIEAIPEEIEKAEAVAGAEISLPQPVTDDTGAVVLDDAAPKQVTVTLPLTDKEIEQALHLKVVESFRWLAEWTKRLLKKAGGKFLYKST